MEGVLSDTLVHYRGYLDLVKFLFPWGVQYVMRTFKTKSLLSCVSWLYLAENECSKG